MNDMRKLMEKMDSLFEESEYQELLDMLEVAEKKLEDCYDKASSLESSGLGEKDFAQRISNAQEVIMEVIFDVMEKRKFESS